MELDVVLMLAGFFAVMFGVGFARRGRDLGWIVAGLGTAAIVVAALVAKTPGPALVAFGIVAAAEGTLRDESKRSASSLILTGGGILAVLAGGPLWAAA